MRQKNTSSEYLCHAFLREVEYSSWVVFHTHTHTHTHTHHSVLSPRAQKKKWPTLRVRVLWSRWLFGNGGRRMLTYADVCWRMLTLITMITLTVWEWWTTATTKTGKHKKTTVKGKEGERIIVNWWHQWYHERHILASRRGVDPSKKFS